MGFLSDMGIEYPTPRKKRAVIRAELDANRRYGMHHHCDPSTAVSLEAMKATLRSGFGS